MESPIQDDPYEALGVNKLSTAGDIKTAYRKLVLKSHPDKFPDPTIKQQKADEFHKIQQAYEILNDEEKRSRYDARVRLAELKAEMMKREGGRDSLGKSSRYERPSAATYPSFRTTTATYEVRTPRFTDEFYDEPKSTTRRSDPSAAYYRRSSPTRSKPDRERRVEKEDKSRSERRRARDEQVREARDRKYYSSPTDDFNERAKYEEERKRRDDVVKQKEEETRRYMKMEETRREEALRATAKPKVYENSRAAQTVYDVKIEDARRYQANAEQMYSSARPPMERRSSAQQYDIRRSRARASERRRSPDIVEDRVPPSFPKSATTSEMLREMAGERGLPIRSHSHNVSSQDRDYPAPPAQMRRADTMPVKTSSSSRREKEPSRSARLRETLQPDSGYSSSSPTTPEAKHPYIPNHHPDIPPASMSTASVNRTTQYHYGPPAGAPERITVTTSPDKYTSSQSYKTEIRSPVTDRGRDKDRERRRERERPPLTSSRTFAAPGADHIPYSHVRAPSYSHRSPDAERERDRVRASERESRRSEKSRGEMEYAEVPSEYTRRHNMQPKSYKDNEINIGKRPDYEDIVFSGRTRGRDDSFVRRHEKERYDRPSMVRSTTTAFG